MAAPGLLELIQARAHARPAVMLTGLMIASALSEGVGIVLLVPMLATMSGGGGLAGGRLAKVLAALQLPLQLGPLLALFVVVVLLRELINHARSRAAMSFGAGLVDALRQRALRALLQCDWRVLVTMRHADNTSLLITIFDRIGFAVEQAIAALAATITLAGLAAAAWLLSPAIALGAVAGGVLVLGLYRGLRRRATGLGKALDDASRRIHRDLSEQLAALRLIKSLGRESATEASSTAQFGDLRQAQRVWQHSAGLGQAALEGGGAVLLATLVWVALVRWHTPAVIVLPMVALFVRALPLLGSLQLHWQNWCYARPAIAAARDLISQTEAAQEAQAGDGGPAPELRRAIVMEQVSVRFSKDIAPALDAVTLTIGARETVMVTGHSGAGKSTLADLLGGLLSPDGGQIRIDDTVLTDAARRGWRRRVAYVQQEPVLLSGTVRDNLLWANPRADSADLQAALLAASAEFVNTLPLGLDTPIGEGGRRLSGGERQRIVLARALLRNPALLILDEATSALDAANIAAIAAALAGLKGKLAMVIVGHSDPLAALADRTIMLERGRIVPASVIDT